MCPRPAFESVGGKETFSCTACESTRCTRVTVKKRNGILYETEFAKCSDCRVMYHHPGPLPVFDQAPPAFHSGHLAHPPPSPPQFTEPVNPFGKPNRRHR